MKTALTIAVLAGVPLVAIMYYLAERLSSDAIGMALGLGFGVLASIPAVLLVVVASKRRPPYDYSDDYVDNPPALSTMPMAPPSTGNSFRIIEPTSHQRGLVRSEPVYDYSDGGVTIRWPEPVPCVLLWPGRPVERRWSQFTTPINEALSGQPMICYVLESEWNRYATQKGAYS